MIRDKLPNSWGYPAEDPRFEGLLAISRAISDAHDVASGQQGILLDLEMHPEIYHYWSPLRLAEAMEKAAQRIRKATQDSPN
jgi:hypothetical protein